MDPKPLIRVQVPLGARAYDIVIGTQLLKEAGALLLPALPSRRVIVISDEQVASRYLHRVSNALAEEDIRYASLVLPAGEQTKSLEHFNRLLTLILEQSPDRKTTIVALGGGVVGDIAGFAASVVLRGLPFIQIPTTLLAQVDSSVGGKTGVNAAYGKNAVGSFYQPRLVLIDTETLSTLPKRELLAGYAEIVKYGLLGDAGFFDWLEQNGKAVLEGNAEKQRFAIAQSCRAKATIVAEDEREESGKRALLNLGHTFAHALESETGYSDTLLHGEAVAVGMALAFRLSQKLGVCSSEEAARVESHLKNAGLRIRLADIRQQWNIDRLMEHFSHDKKTSHGALTFVLVKRIGQAFVQENVPPDVVRDVLEEAML